MAKKVHFCNLQFYYIFDGGSNGLINRQSTIQEAFPMALYNDHFAFDFTFITSFTSILISGRIAGIKIKFKHLQRLVYYIYTRRSLLILQELIVH